MSEKEVKTPIPKLETLLSAVEEEVEEKKSEEEIRGEALFIETRKEKMSSLERTSSS